MENLKFYPTLTDELRDNAGICIEKYVFTYMAGENEYGLKQKGSSTIKLTDPLEMWKVEDEGLVLKKRITIAYPQQLHGATGIACKQSQIGICIIWTNHELTQTGCILPESDNITPSGRTCEFAYSFESGQIKGDLELSVCMYIKKKSDVVLPGEESLMNEEGVSVGELENIIVDFNSAFMEFPIEEYSSENEPLWWVELPQWEDPKSIELFDKENVCLYLNPYYTACPMTDGSIKNLDLLVEILAMSYFLMFERLSDDDRKATINNIGLAPNSICSILHQFIETCNESELHFESPEKLLKSLQINIRKRLTEGDEQ